MVYFKYSFGFDFDPFKSRANKIKHGIDFFEAQDLWADNDLVNLPCDYREEKRFMAIGSIGHIIWTAVFCFREEKIRLISVRRARENEKQTYLNQRA